MSDRSLDQLDLLDWRRRVSELYSRIRASGVPTDAWHEWRAIRDELFRNHPQSPIPPEKREDLEGLPYFPYDERARVHAEVHAASLETHEIGTSTGVAYRFSRFGEARFSLFHRDLALQLYWLEGYGGGLFVPFRDTTAGSTTYGAGRYLLDTVKGADLGSRGSELVFDFNFAYNPSCSYDPQWVCPLAPPPNRLDISIEAGERSLA